MALHASSSSSPMPGYKCCSLVFGTSASYSCRREDIIRRLACCQKRHMAAAVREGSTEAVLSSEQGKQRPAYALPQTQ